jgi:hypothetical protein
LCKAVADGIKAALLLLSDTQKDMWQGLVGEPFEYRPEPCQREI